MKKYWFIRNFLTFPSFVMNSYCLLGQTPNGNLPRRQKAKVTEWPHLPDNFRKDTKKTFCVPQPRVISSKNKLDKMFTTLVVQLYNILGQGHFNRKLGQGRENVSSLYGHRKGCSAEEVGSK